METLDFLVSGIEGTDMGWQRFSTLLSWVIASHGSGGKGALDAVTAERLKTRWTKFLQDHREALRAGRRFTLDDPALTPDLMPGEHKLYRKDSTPWP